MCHIWTLLRWWFTVKRRYTKCMDLLYLLHFNCCQLYIATCAKVIYRCTSFCIPGCKVLPWNFVEIIQLSIRTGAHKLFHHFFESSHFYRNFAKIGAKSRRCGEKMLIFGLWVKLIPAALPLCGNAAGNQLSLTTANRPVSSCAIVDYLLHSCDNYNGNYSNIFQTYG